MNLTTINQRDRDLKIKDIFSTDIQNRMVNAVSVVYTNLKSLTEYLGLRVNSEPSTSKPDLVLFAKDSSVHNTQFVLKNIIDYDTFKLSFLKQSFFNSLDPNIIFAFFAPYAVFRFLKYPMLILAGTLIAGLLNDLSSVDFHFDAIVKSGDYVLMSSVPEGVLLKIFSAISSNLENSFIAENTRLRRDLSKKTLLCLNISFYREYNQRPDKRTVKIRDLVRALKTLNLDLFDSNEQLVIKALFLLCENADSGDSVSFSYIPACMVRYGRVTQFNSSSEGESVVHKSIRIYGTEYLYRQLDGSNYSHAVAACLQDHAENLVKKYWKHLINGVLFCRLLGVVCAGLGLVGWVDFFTELSYINPPMDAMGLIVQRGVNRLDKIELNEKFSDITDIYGTLTHSPLGKFSDGLFSNTGSSTMGAVLSKLKFYNPLISLGHLHKICPRGLIHLHNNQRYSEYSHTISSYFREPSVGIVSDPVKTRLSGSSLPGVIVKYEQKKIRLIHSFKAAEGIISSSYSNNIVLKDFLTLSKELIATQINLRTPEGVISDLLMSCNGYSSQNCDVSLHD